MNAEDTDRPRVEPMMIDGAWIFTPRLFGDARGAFCEYFRQDMLETRVGHPLDVRQGNCSVSAAGVVRGIHFADVPPGQAKYVACASGAILDVVVDLRVGSPTFGRWDSAVLDDRDRRAVYVAEGLGHAFMSLVDGSTVLYLCSSFYAPEREHGVHPLDADLGIAWPSTAPNGTSLTVQLSDKDATAPTLQQARHAGMLPTYEETIAHYDALRRRS